jgi:hypothetical protein
MCRIQIRIYAAAEASRLGSATMRSVLALIASGKTR